MNTLEIIKLIDRGTLLKLGISRIYLSGFNVLFSMLIQRSIDSVVSSSPTQPLWLTSVGLIMSSVVFILIYYYFNYQLKVSFQEINKTLGSRLIDSILRQSSEESTLDEGEMLTLFSQDIDTISDYLSYGLMPLVDMGLTLFFGVLYVLTISWYVALLFLLVGLVLGGINHVNARNMEVAYGNYMDVSDEHHRLYEHIYGAIPIVRIFKIERWLWQHHTHYFKQRTVHYGKYNTLTANAYVVTEGGILVVDVLSIIVGLWLVFQGRFPLGSMLGARNAGLGSILYPCSSLPTYYRYYAQFKASLERLNNHYHASLFVNEEVKSDYLPIQIENITFSYANQSVLRHFSCHIPSTGLTFVVGASGSGKSTLFHLLTGQLTPQLGHILWNNQPFVASDIDRSIAFVTQKNQLLLTTIRDNLTLGDECISDDDIQEVCQRLNIWEEIHSLPLGLDSIYGQECQWSSGQQRRLCIARAVLSQCPLVLLDEPFSDIDLANQSHVMDYLVELSQYRSIVLITHTEDFIAQAMQVIKVGE